MRPALAICSSVSLILGLLCLVLLSEGSDGLERSRGLERSKRGLERSKRMVFLDDQTVKPMQFDVELLGMAPAPGAQSVPDNPALNSYLEGAVERERAAADQAISLDDLARRAGERRR
ncbi:protein ORF119 [Cyprinid herpesvirus 3]|nr:unnamed protein product [Cyprinid herpesvirus 3]ABG42946.2 protein ORF119 [Cyprinid herpesvirus 3]AIC32474.1 ORF119R [Cyprinid herpesvirus 3]AJP55607.1 protein ORF119 [Cyprinid herpesvirus 3]AJP55762.1 protein ORF119 [Cyprinid herpesvirus 3]AOO32523.1 protein ORF119 [Cyprinid herpesvirus 3]